MAQGRQQDPYGDRAPHQPPLAPPSRYSAWFAPRAPTSAGSTIRLPGDAPHAPPDRVVRPALAVLFRIAVGPSADRYVRRFLAFERAGHVTPGWHWPSLLFPGIWAFYRKLWMEGLLFASLPILGAFAFAVIEPRLRHADLLWITCAVLAIWILPGVLPALIADSLLYRHCRALIKRAESGARGATDAVQRLSQLAPTSAAAAGLLGGGALLAVAAVVGPPLRAAYVDLNVREKLTQALGAVRGLEREIELSWRSGRVVPDQFDKPRIRAQRGADVIEDVHVHPRTGRVRLALGPAVPELAGKTILLAPTRDASNRWHWLCVPVDIPERYLPEECRG